MVYGVEQERDRIHHWERHVDAVEERRAMSTSAPLARSARHESQRYRSRKTTNSESVATWMKQPIDGDASWAPIPPPNLSPRPFGSVKLTTPVAQPRQNPPKTSSNVTRSPKTPNKQTNPPKADNHQSGLSIEQRDPIPPPNPVSSSSDSSTASDLPCSNGRGRTTDRTALLQSQHGSPATNRRGRSRTSRTPTERAKSPSSVKPSTPHHHSRGRSASRGHSTERGRSTSKTRVTERPRSTSRTRVHNIGSSAPNAVHPIGHKGSHTQRSRSVSQTPKPRSRSQSRPRGSSKPPATSRTRAQYHGVGSSSSVGPSLPRHARAGRPGSDDGSIRGRDISFGRTAPVTSRSMNSKGKQRKQGGLMEKLFGDHVSEQAKQSYLPGRDTSSCAVSVSSRMSTQQPDRIHPRILLSATIYHNTASGLWIATINTNQKGVAKNPTTASKYLKAFSFPSEREARESAIANAPPKMLHFDTNPNCFICNGKFAVFRRPGHCRNCGVCVCNGCSTTWAAKMIPETYNLKGEAQVKICKSCHHLNCSFKRALLDGDYEESIALYGTGNVNLRTQCPPTNNKKKEELMFPIHCAVEGGNLEIVRWLMDEHFCPIKVVRTGSNKNSRQGNGYDVPILTTKGRSVLAIALHGLKVDILRYLVVEKGVSVYETKDLKYTLQALEAVLHAFPERSGGLVSNGLISPRWDNRTYSDSDEGSVSSSLDDGAESHAEEVPVQEDKDKQHAVSVSTLAYE